MEKMHFDRLNGAPLIEKPMEVAECIEEFTRELKNQETLPELAVFLDRYAGSGDARRQIPGMGPIVQKFMDMHENIQKEPLKSDKCIGDFYDDMHQMEHPPEVAKLVKPILDKMADILNGGIRLAA